MLGEAARLVDVDLLDHVIVGDAKADPRALRYYSFRAAGLGCGPFLNGGIFHLFDVIRCWISDGSLAKRESDPMETSAFLEFARLVVAGEIDQLSRQLQTAPALATTVSPVGASRQQATDFFFPSIGHYLYAGDTALHLAAAAFSRPMAKLLISRGADCRARNRRGAEPLHYASEGGRGEPRRQASVIEYLIAAGADPNAVDKIGATPLLRAVRTRSVAAVKALLQGGADARKPNKSGSTPLHLAVQNTGASGSGTDDARRQQAAIIRLLLAAGAKPTDKDARGKTVKQAATSEWIRELLSGTKGG